MTDKYGGLPITEDENVPVGSSGVVVPDVVTPSPHRLDPARKILPWFGLFMGLAAIVVAILYGVLGRTISSGEMVLWGLANGIALLLVSSMPVLERWSESLDRRQWEAARQAQKRRGLHRDWTVVEEEKASQHYHVTPDLIEPVTALDNGTTPEEEAEISKRSNENNPEWLRTLERANTHRGQISYNERIWLAVNSLRPDVTQEQVDKFLADLSEGAAEELADIVREVTPGEMPPDIAKDVETLYQDERSSRPSVSEGVEPSPQWAVEDQEYDPAKLPEQEPPVDTAKEYQDRLVNGQCQSFGPATGDQCYRAAGHKGSHRGEEHGSMWKNKRR